MIFHFHVPPRELHPQRVAGRLQFFAQNWQIITQDPWLLQTIQGYKIELLSHPRQASLPSPPLLSPPQTSLVQEEIISLLQKGAIIEVAFNPWAGFYSNLFLVEKKGGSGQRPVINLSRFNNYVEYCHFKMEDLKAVADLLRPGDFMCKLDLKDAYFSVPLHRRSQKFIRFQFQGKTYQFTCLPFGLTSAPRIFTKILKPVTGILRKMGIRIIVYLDNMLIMNSTLEGARKDIMILKSILENLGFLINMEKSIFVPVHTDHRIPGNHHGLHDNEVSPPRRESCCYSERVSPLGKQSSHLFKSTLSHNREVNFLQNCSSSSPSSLSGDPTFEEQHRSSPGSQQRRHTFGSSCPRRPQVVGRQSFPGKWSPHSEFPSASNDSIRCLQFGVGSSEQWGRHQGNLDKGGIQSSYQLQRATSSIICSESIHQRAKKCPCVDSNRQYDNHCLHQQNGGCQKVSPRSLCKTPLGLVSTKANHPEGCLNTIADRESRAKPDSSDWHLNQQSFQMLMRDLGQCTIDLFASRTNHQLPRFYSYKPDPEAEAIDALIQPWAGEIGYAFPPFNLVAKCLRKVIHEAATITLVCPVWPTQPWYAQLLQLVVATPILLPTTAGLLVGPQGQEHPLVNNKTLLQAGWRVSGKAFLQKAYQDRLQTLSSLPRELQLRISTSHAGQSGWAGVISNKLIPFNQVFQRL